MGDGGGNSDDDCGGYADVGVGWIYLRIMIHVGILVMARIMMLRSSIKRNSAKRAQ